MKVQGAGADSVGFSSAAFFLPLFLVFCSLPLGAGKLDVDPAVEDTCYLHVIQFTCRLHKFQHQFFFLIST